MPVHLHACSVCCTHGFCQALQGGLIRCRSNLREIFDQRLEEMAPQERQCRYNLSRRKGASVSAAARGAVAGVDTAVGLRPDLMAALADKRRDGGSSGPSMNTVFWRRTVLAVESETQKRPPLCPCTLRSALGSAGRGRRRKRRRGGAVLRRHHQQLRQLRGPLFGRPHEV